MMSFTCILLNEAAATQPAEKYHDSSTIQPHSIKTAAAAAAAAADDDDDDGDDDGDDDDDDD
jgi:hypothetical protein